jgi:hypothetical protein
MQEGLGLRIKQTITGSAVRRKTYLQKKQIYKLVDFSKNLFELIKLISYKILYSFDVFYFKVKKILKIYYLLKS